MSRSREKKRAGRAPVIPAAPATPTLPVPAPLPPSAEELAAAGEPVRDAFRPVALRVGETSYAGRGVFALEPIAAGALIEECPILELSQDELQAVMKTMLGNYFFQWGPAREEGALALGYGSLYNHSYTPNATYIRKFHTKTLMFVAVRDIAPGDEVTVNYNGFPEDKSPVWF